MAMSENGTQTQQLPTTVRVGGTPRLTPNELRMLKVTTGRTLQELFADEADAMQAMVWVKLRREGFSVSWDQAGDVEADMADAPVDPMNAPDSLTLPRSVDSGA